VKYDMLPWNRFCVALANMVLLAVLYGPIALHGGCLDVLAPLSLHALAFLCQLIVAIVVSAKRLKVQAEMWWLGVGSLLPLSIITLAIVGPKIYCNGA